MITSLYILSLYLTLFIFPLSMPDWQYTYDKMSILEVWHKSSLKKNKTILLTYGFWIVFLLPRGWTVNIRS